MEKPQTYQQEGKSSLFRKKSLEHISSPEELHDYMRVTSPKLWMLLSIVIALLAGFVVYASTATMENAMPVPVQVENYHFNDPNTGEDYYGKAIYAELDISYMETLKPGMKVRLAGETGSINSFYTSEDKLGVLIDMDNEKLPLPDGSYEAEIVLESVTPISFLLN